jgi:nucleoside-diphosphate-sugar epimerase
MTTTIFLAGATGAIGSQLVPLLVDAGYRVFGTTRSKDKASALEKTGAEPVVLDVFDVAAVDAAFSRVRPEVLIHMLTGTRNLIAAAKSAGTRRAIAQSLAWFYASGAQPYREHDALGTTDPDLQIVLEAVQALERTVLETPPIEGILLRYGLLYGPGTSSDEPQGSCTLHVQAAARAALLAIEKGKPGVYNIADDSPAISTEKAQRDLGWNSAFRRRDGGL